MISKATAIWLLGILLALCSVAQAKGISHKKILLYLEDDIVKVDIAQKYELGDKVKEALENGVPITFVTRVRMYADNPYFWEKDVANLKIVRKIAYHPLSELYSVIGRGEGNTRTFATLEAALNELGRMTKREVIERKKLDLESFYMIEVETELEISALPIPLQMTAYFSSDWYMSSEVWKWRMQP